MESPTDRSVTRTLLLEILLHIHLSYTYYIKFMRAEKDLL
jgi:hypothetical protein